MAFNVGDYLRDHSVALLRNNWGGGGSLLFAQEVFTIFSGIQRSIEQVTTTDQNGDPYQVPKINYPQVDLGSFDFDIPGNPAYPPPTITTPPPTTQNQNPEHQNPPQETPQTSSQTITQRNCFPGKVLDGASGALSVYKNGLNNPPEDVTGVLIDPSFPATTGQWVVVWMVARYLVSVTIAQTTSTANVNADDVVYLYLPMGGGGGGLAVTVTQIGGRSDPSDPRSDIGTGVGILRLLVDGTWVDGDTVTLYNSTSTVVELGKLVQWKLISGLRFVDVEDCGA